MANLKQNKKHQERHCYYFDLNKDVLATEESYYHDIHYVNYVT